MGWSIKKPLGNLGKKTGIRIPSIKKIDSNIRAEAKRAGKGEVGKLVGGIGQSYFNVVTTIPRAIVTGDIKKAALRGVTSGINVAGFGVPGYLGKSSTAQRVLRSETTKKFTLGFSENVAGYQRGIAEGSKSGMIRQDDWINIYQGAAKIGAVVGTVGAASYFAAPAPAAAPVPESLAGMTISQPATFGPTTAELMAGASTAAPAATPALGATAATTAATAAAPAAAASTGIGTYLQYGAGAALIKSLIPGAQQALAGNPIFMPNDDSNQWAGALNNAINRSPSGAPEAVEAGIGGSTVVVAGVAVVALYLMKRKGMI